MKWEDIPGISLIPDFSEIYMESGLINKVQLFDNTNRAKYGYLWDLSTEYIQGIGRTVGENLTGILINNDLDSRVVQGLYNSCFFQMNKVSLLNGVKSYGNITNNAPNLSQSFLDESRWGYYRDILKNLYNNDYVPVKRYLGQDVKEKIWIPLTNESQNRDASSRKGYYQMVKWILGNETIILELPEKYQKMWLWETIIQEKGPMKNPELLFIEDFATEFPGSIKHIPEEIVKKIGLEPLEGLDFFGITFS